MNANDRLAADATPRLPIAWRVATSAPVRHAVAIALLVWAIAALFGARG